MKSLLKLLSLTAMIITFSCTKPSGEEPGGNDVQGGEQGQPQQPTVYTVGDYYKVGLSKGVVVSVDATGQHGMIVSLDEEQKMWAIQPVCVLNYQVTNTADDGKVNSQAIKDKSSWSMNGVEYPWAQLFPAVHWCSTKNIGQLTSWYLPAIDELQQVLASVAQNAAKINKSLTDNGGNAFTVGSDVYFWSSTDHGPQIACASGYSTNTNPEGDDYYYATIDKDQELRVRCIRKF